MSFQMMQTEAPRRAKEGMAADDIVDRHEPFSGSSSVKSAMSTDASSSVVARRMFRNMRLAVSLCTCDWGVTLSIVLMPILQQIWLGLYWILRCEMNIFWAGGICLRSYNEDYPLGPRDKLACGLFSKYHCEMKKFIFPLRIPYDPQPISGKIGTQTMLNVTPDVRPKDASLPHFRARPGEVLMDERHLAHVGRDSVSIFCRKFSPPAVNFKAKYDDF